MEKIFSRIEPKKLLHLINRKKDICDRNDIIPADNFLQCAAMKLENGKTFLPHKHITKDRHYLKQIAQESWIVIEGKVKCILYDIDDTIIATPILEAGDASFTLYGGHTYEIIEDNTIIYEYKTGPYEGQEMDKIFLKK